MNYAAEGVILARRNFSEADRIISVFTKNFGKLSVIAKGVRKPMSRKRGHLEVFSYIKFIAHRGKTLDLMTEVATIDSFTQVRKNLKKVAVAYFVVEVIAKITREEAKNEDLFELLVETLQKLKANQNLRGLREDFVYQALVLAGFWPRGKAMDAPDKILEEVTERRIKSIRVGKKLLA